jgi:hypothetical protein
MRQLTPGSGLGLPHEYRDTGGSDHSDPVPLRSMVDTAVPTHNADVDWGGFSSHDYWRHNYEKVLPADQEIIDLVSSFFIKAFRGRARVQRAIDVGSGTNLYPALLMLPWAEQILLSDYSASNVDWLRRQVMNDDDPWTWQSFWRELGGREGYEQVSEPRKQLREACAGQGQRSGIKRHSVFRLPPAQWQLGTMFFVAESITRDPGEFAKAIKRFIGALEPNSPFAAAFMSGSEGYTVGDVTFPAVPITETDITGHFAQLHVSELSVELRGTAQLVREGYEGMIVATGITDSPREQH